MCTYFLYIQDKKNVKHEGTDIENEKKKTITNIHRLSLINIQCLVN